MEVHSHTHTARKKWTHYFWEFFMLFLAVTLGFFVENRREHFVEHLREKEYAKSLYENLKSDTFWIELTYKEKLWTIEKMDSLEMLLSSPADIAKNNELIYYFERFIGRHTVFTGNDVTYRQLLNSGNFRYFKNFTLNNKISNYYILYDRYQSLGEEAYEKAGDLSELESKLFSGRELGSLNDPNGGSYFDLFKRPETRFRVINSDPQVLSLFHIKIDNTQYALHVSRRFLLRLKTFANEAIEEIKKEYHLK